MMIVMLETVSLPGEAGPLEDVAPIDRSRWLVLGRDGRVGSWDLRSGDYRFLVDSEVSESDRTPWGRRSRRRRLHTSLDGSFAAVVQDYGRGGAVLDLGAGRVTMTVDGGDYRPETVPFSLVFAEYDGRTVVVHRTDWNRLDVSVASTGELLTARATSEDTSGEHDLDYFHGRLHLSPDGRRLLDDGWVWQPLGVASVWSLDEWLGENVWASEDARWGPTNDVWDVAMTWIDDTRVAVEWVDEDEPAPGGRILDTTTVDGPAGRRVPGAVGRYFSDGRLLFSADEVGLHAWEPESGERLWTEPGFSPTHHHRPGGVFLELGSDHARTWQGEGH